MTLSHSQRWVERNGVWVPERHVCDVKKLEVAVIPDDTTAKDFVLAHHYSGSYPAARLRVGLYEAGELVGVAVYSTPSNQSVIPCWADRPAEEGVELGRFVLLDRVGFNAESWFWSRARRMVRRHLPEVGVILAYSDPIARETLDGEVVLPGHVGTIYQATNGAYLGRATARTLYLDVWGRVVSPRSISKILGGERGEAYATAQLEEATRTTRRDGESKRQWVERAKRQLRKVRHTGNHVYLWGVTKRDAVPASKTYPKQVDPVQLGLLEVA